MKFSLRPCGRNHTPFLFIYQSFYFFKHKCYPFQNSSLGQLHTDGDVFPSFGSSAGSLQLVWSSACPLHPWQSFLYKGVLEMLRKRIIRVRPDISDKWVLHHDNTPCYTALSVTEFLNSKGIPVVPQPPFS